MRVVINAQMHPETSGGIAQVVFGLADALGRLLGDERYLFVCSEASAGFLEPVLGSNSQIVLNQRTSPAPHRGVRDSDGFWESFKPDVLHFPYQSYTRTGIPTVFNPHDLQHRHLPGNFSVEECARRDALYGKACELADIVAVASSYVREDVVRAYGVSHAKVEVIAWPPTTRICEDLSPKEVNHRLGSLGLREPFALYPARIWPHKNHLRLIQAIAMIREKSGLEIPLVLTGGGTEHAAIADSLIRDCHLTHLIKRFGHVDAPTLLAMYRGARILVMPTLFEAMSLPIFEAFAEHLPVACSNVTSLPEQVGNAAVVFDPLNVSNMALHIERLWSSNTLQRELVRRGALRVKQFTRERMARQYRDLYRRLAREDCRLDMCEVAKQTADSLE